MSEFWIAAARSGWAREQCPFVTPCVMLWPAARKKIILNLEEINYIDSSGVGELIGAYTFVVNEGGRLKLLHLTKRIREVLAITKLLTVFEVFDDEKAALASFA
jgi:anti-anti-sigma factor